MEFKQIVSPNTNTVSGAGWCLRFAQSVFNAPVMYSSAKIASENTQVRHYTRDLPDVSVVLWFDHWGTYGGVYANWGHVAVWVPGVGVLSSPFYKGFGQEWYPSISAIEKTFNAKFLFWSEDINTLRVVEPLITPSPGTPEEEDEDMAEAHSMEASIRGTVTQCVYDTDGFYTEWIGGNSTYNSNIRSMFGVKTLHCSVSESHFNAIKASVLAKGESIVTIITPEIPVLPEKEGPRA